MISSRPTVPLLVHEDCMDGIKTDLAGQQEILSKIKVDTGNTAESLFAIENGSLPGIRTAVEDIGLTTSSIKTSSSNTATATSSLYSSVGTTTDASTSNTVIGLLKSIANKL